MPLTALVATALKLYGRAAAKSSNTFWATAGTSFVLPPAEPPELSERQKQAWILARWIHVPMESGCSRHRHQFYRTTGRRLRSCRMQEIVSGLDDFRTAAFDAAAARAASFVVALAAIERHITGEEAFALSHLDELYQRKNGAAMPKPNPAAQHHRASWKAIRTLRCTSGKSHEQSKAVRQ